MESRSMLEKLILYFVYATKGYITKTQLVKFLYLADLYSVKWTGKQLTELDWYFYHHGPWHDDIEAALEHLRDLIAQKPEGKAILIQMGNNPIDVRTLEFSQGLRLMLENIRSEWAGITNDNIERLLEYVYSTEPMLAVKDKHDKSDKVPLDLSLERKSLMAELGV